MTNNLEKYTGLKALTNFKEPRTYREMEEICGSIGEDVAVFSPEVKGVGFDFGTKDEEVEGEYTSVTIRLDFEEPITTREVSGPIKVLSKATSDNIPDATDTSYDYLRGGKITTNNKRYVELRSLSNFKEPRTIKELKAISEEIAETILTRAEGIEDVKFNYDSVSNEVAANDSKEYTNIIVRSFFKEPVVQKEVEHLILKVLPKAVTPNIPDVTDTLYHYVEVDEGEEEK